MNNQQATAPPTRFRLAFLGPVAVGIVLVVAAFIVASIFAGGSGKSDPLNGQISKAEAQVRAAPNDSAARVSVADLYLQANRVDDAIAQYQQALSITPDTESALYGLGRAEQKKGDLNAAGAAFQKIIQLDTGKSDAALDPTLQGAHFYLGEVLRSQKRYGDAINEFRTALGLNRADADTLFELAKTFALNGDNKDASQAFDVALEYVPDYRDAYVEVQKLATKMGDKNKANYAGAMLMVLDGKAKQAVPILRKAAQQGGLAHEYWALGYALEKTNDRAGAMAAYQKAIDIDPGEMMAGDSLRRLQAGG